MKTKALFALFVTVILFGLLACKGKPEDPKELLMKKWKPVDVSGPQIDPASKSKVLAGDNSIEFGKDGKFSSITDGKKDIEGTYTVSEDVKTVTLKAASGEMQNIVVKKLTKDSMVGQMMGSDFIFITYK